MVQGAVIRIIAIVLGLFVIFSVVSPVVIGLNELYLHSIPSCNFGTAQNPEKALRFGTASGWFGVDDIDINEVDWGDASKVLVLFSATEPESISLRHCNYDDGVATQNQYYVSENGAVAFKTLRSASTTFSETHAIWEETAAVFGTQPLMVELLAIITALAIPLGALGAVVFFGNTISVATGTSGMSSQIIAVITTVVVILVIVKVFGQFIVHLDDAFEVIDKNRFAVYDNGLGTLAETITSFWGILAFASILPIGFSLFRQYQLGGGISGFGGEGRGV